MKSYKQSRTTKATTAAGRSVMTDIVEAASLLAGDRHDGNGSPKNLGVAIGKLTTFPRRSRIPRAGGVRPGRRAAEGDFAKRAGIGQMLVTASQGARWETPGVFQRPSPDECRWNRSFAFPYDRDPFRSVLHGARDLRFVSRGEADSLFKRRKRQIERHMNQIAHG